LIRLIYFIIIFSFIRSQGISDFSYFGADASAMVGSVVSSEGGSWSIAHNPASISDIENSKFSIGGGNLFGYSWLPAYYMNSYFKLPVIGNIGIAYYQLKTRYKDMDLSSEQTLSLANSYKLQNDNNSHLSFGFTMNLIRWDLGRSAGVSGDGSDGLLLGSLQSFTFDLGIQASLRGRYRFGATIKNFNSGMIGSGLSAQPLPRRIDLGVSYFPIRNLETSVSLQRLLGQNDLQIKGAIQYKLYHFFTLRMGLQANPNRFASGFSINYGGFTFDYGFLGHPILPATHQMQLGYSL